jgi:hypothetical protein
MAPESQALDSGFPPNAPIPGRGLPPSVCAEIPTLQIRIARAGALFVTSLLAAAMLAIGPAVVIAKIGAGAPVVVAMTVAVPHLAPPFTASQHELLVRWLRRRPPNDWRARGVMFVAGAPGSPRGRTHDAGVKPRRAPGPGNGGPARLAAHRLRWRPAAGESLPLARRQRPPPRRAGTTAYRNAELIALAPATPPLVWWCGPIFLSLRV